MLFTDYFSDIEKQELRSVLWQCLWRKDFQRLADQKTVAVLPIGSVEQHGPHCPPDVDISIPYCIAVESALRVRGEDPAVVVPPVWSGYTHYNMGHPGTITLSLDTFHSVVKDVCRSVYQNGFHRIILLNGHGGNAPAIKSIATDLSREDIYVLPLTYFEMISEDTKKLEEQRRVGQGDIGHAGEIETSFQLYLRRELVDEDEIVEGDRPQIFPDPVHEYAGFPERRRESENGVMGDPTLATAEKGRKLFEVSVEKLTEAIKEFRKISPLRYEKE